MRILLVFILVVGWSQSFCQKITSDGTTLTSGNTQTRVGHYDGNGKIVWDSSATDNIGERYFRYIVHDIPQCGKYCFKEYDGDGVAQYCFFNGYMYNMKYWWHGKLVDNTNFKKVIQHFKIK
jgi:hypothetical protein